MSVVVVFPTLNSRHKRSARAQSKHIGRPAISRKVREQIVKRFAAGETPYRIGKELGVDRATAAKYAADFA